MLFNFGRPITVVLTCLILVLGGCGDSGPARIPGEGRVSYQGKPLPSAAISFLPVSGNGPAANGEIINGAYKFTDVDGPSAGSHKVIIAVIQKGKLPGEGMGEPHGNNEYEFDVPAEGPFKKDFKFELPRR